MPLTTLDPTTALVVIDLQRGLVRAATAHPMAGVIGNAASLAAAFRRCGLPVVLVNVEGRPPGRSEHPGGLKDQAPGWTDLVPELEAQPGDHRVTKRAASAFAGTDLDQRLRGLGVTQVVIAGVVTSFGVEATARQAFDLGFNVTLAIDAMTDTSAEAHDNSVARIFPRLGETGRTAEVLALLAQR